MKSKIALAVLMAVTAMTPLAAKAQMKFEADRWWDNRWYVTPFGSYTLSDGDRKTDDAWGYGLSLGKSISPNWNLELRGQYETMDPKLSNGSQFKVWTAGLDLHWFFLGREGYSRHNDLQPYLIGGIGAIRDKAAGQSATSFMADAGMGVLWPFSDWGRLFVDGRYRFDQNHNNLVSHTSFGDWIFSAGLQIPLGKVPEVAAPVRAAPVMVAPPPPAPPPPPPPQPVSRKFELLADAMFAFNSTVLSEAGKGHVNAMLTELNNAGVTSLSSITVIGFTDPIGSPQYNLKLSAERANAVRDYLVASGVPASLIATEGLGEAQLKITEADCASQGKSRPRSALIACLAPDRRVEIGAIGTQTVAQ
ncbi:MAG: OmpA family protein [Burkholderiaceae bacterium]